jgi:GTPase
MKNELPIIAVVGRPNVGKSTLFNRLTRHWSSIVENREGITRDRLYGEATVFGHRLRIMDTGGLQLNPETVVEKKMSDQALMGIEEADLIIFVMDGRAGVTPLDREWIKLVRKLKKDKIYVVNKLDQVKLDDKLTDFYELGVNPLVPMSFETERNFSGLNEAICEALKLSMDGSEETEVAEENRGEFNIAIAGKPNVGKSTLLNALLDEERSIVDNVPGTTRDPIHSWVSYKDITYKFVDTAGIRRRAKTKERVEKFSVVASLNAIDKADIVLLLIDSEQGPTEQDAHVAGYAHKKNKAIILVANKWDLGQKRFETRQNFEEKLELKMNYLRYCPVIYISAKTGRNLSKVFHSIEHIKKQYQKTITTGELNRAFEHIVEHHPLPLYNGQPLKMYYATQMGSRPPSFMIFCNYPDQVHFSYKRYLMNSLREIFELENIPVKVTFKGRK